MDQGDFDFNVFLDRKNKNKDKYKDQLLSKEELQRAVELLKEEGTEKYEICTITPNALKKFNFYKRILVFLNLPLVMVLPIFSEFFLDFTHPKANAMYALLYTADTFLFINAYMIYKMLKQAIISINYLVNEDKFEIKHFSSLSKNPLSAISGGEGKNVGIVDPAHIAKAPKAMLNPFIGYRNTETDQR